MGSSIDITSCYIQGEVFSVVLWVSRMSLAEAFLYAGARPIDDYRNLVSDYPNLNDTPSARLPLLNLDSVLERMERFNVNLPCML